MATNFDGMSHEQIYQAVHTGVPAVVSDAASQLADLNTTISGHLDVLDKLSKSMADAWPDENGQNFRATLSHTVGYLRELQATHVTTASSSITQVMSASHEKLSSTQSTLPTPPAVPVSQQEATLNKESSANGGAMNQGMAMQSQNIAAAKANDAKAVALAKGLANTYMVEKAKLTAPPAAPKGPSASGSGSSAPVNGVGSGSGSASHAFAAVPTSGSPGANPGSGGTGGTGSVAAIDPVAGSGHTGTSGGGTAGGPVSVGTIGALGGASGHGGINGYGGDGHGGAGGVGGVGGTPGSGIGSAAGSGSYPGGPGSLLDPSGGMAGGAGSTGTGVPGSGSDGGGLGGLVPGLLGGATLGGLGGAGVVAARKASAVRAAEKAALLTQEEEAGLEGSGAQSGASLTASQVAAINAQRSGVLTAGENAGLMNSERSYMSMQQRSMGASSAMSAEEEAEMAAGQRTVPGQLGGSPVAAGSSGTSGARAPFSAGGVVGGAERVTWLVEDRDLWSVDPGVRAVIDD